MTVAIADAFSAVGCPSGDRAYWPDVGSPQHHALLSLRRPRGAPDSSITLSSPRRSPGWTTRPSFVWISGRNHRATSDNELGLDRWEFATSTDDPPDVWSADSDTAGRHLSTPDDPTRHVRFHVNERGIGVTGMGAGLSMGLDSPLRLTTGEFYATHGRPRRVRARSRSRVATARPYPRPEVEAGAIADAYRVQMSTTVKTYCFRMRPNRLPSLRPR